MSFLSCYIIKNIYSTDTKIVETSVILIAKCIEKRNQGQLIDDLLESMEDLPATDSSYYNTKIFIIIKSLCSVIKSDHVIKYLADQIYKKGKNEFSKKIIRNLDLALNIEESMSE